MGGRWRGRWRWRWRRSVHTPLAPRALCFLVVHKRTTKTVPFSLPCLSTLDRNFSACHQTSPLSTSTRSLHICTHGQHRGGGTTDSLRSRCCLMSPSTASMCSSKCSAKRSAYCRCLVSRGVGGGRSSYLYIPRLGRRWGWIWRRRRAELRRATHLRRRDRRLVPLEALDDLRHLLSDAPALEVVDDANVHDPAERGVAMDGWMDGWGGGWMRERGVDSAWSANSGHETRQGQTRKGQTRPGQTRQDKTHACPSEFIDASGDPALSDFGSKGAALLLLMITPAFSFSSSACLLVCLFVTLVRQLSRLVALVSSLLFPLPTSFPPSLPPSLPP